jgi:hypothetical protein
MKSTHAFFATTLLFPLMLFAQPRSSSRSGAGGGGGGSSGSDSHSSGSGSSSSSSASGSGSRTSGGSSGSRSSSSRGASQISARPHDGTQARTEQGRPKVKSLPGTSSVGQEHVKRSWLPWKWHSDKLPRNGNTEEKNLKCKPGKLCKVQRKRSPSPGV